MAYFWISAWVLGRWGRGISALRLGTADFSEISVGPWFFCCPPSSAAKVVLKLMEMGGGLKDQM